MGHRITLTKLLKANFKAYTTWIRTNISHELASTLQSEFDASMELYLDDMETEWDETGYITPGDDTLEAICELSPMLRPYEEKLIKKYARQTDSDGMYITTALAALNFAGRIQHPVYK